MTRLPACCLGASLLVACVDREPPDGATDTQSVDTTDPSTTAPTTGTTPATTTSTSSTTTDGPPTSSTDATTFDTGECAPAPVRIDIARPYFVLAVEKSRWMVVPPLGLWDHDADDADDDGVSDIDPPEPATPPITRWESLHRALEFVLASFDPSMYPGLALFPSKLATDEDGPGACIVAGSLDVPFAPLNGVDILAALPSADTTDLRGGRPGSAAIAVATDELAMLVDDAGVDKHILYITGGAANCQDGLAPPALFESHDDTLHDRVAQAHMNDGVTTHVVGLQIADVVSPAVKDGHPDGVNNHELLDDLAELGGAPRPGAEKFWNAKSEPELFAALDEIVRGTLSCTVVIEPDPDETKVHLEVAVNGVDYGAEQVTDCAAEDGWRSVDGDQTIELCGQACADFQMVGSVDVVFRCNDK